MSATSAFSAGAPAASAGSGSDAAPTCYHCGAPNPERTRWTAVVAGNTRAFCCAGCQAVAETLHAAGLDALYAGRTQSGVRPEGDGDEWMRWSASAEAAGLVRARPDGRREVSLLLEGVTCGACVPLLESWLARQPGVVEAGVNYATRRAHVAFDPAVTQLSSVLRAIAASGYSAFPYDPARREALARRERRALLTRTAIALLAMMQVMMFALPVYLSDDGVAPRELRLLEWASFVLTLPALFYSARAAVRERVAGSPASAPRHGRADRARPRGRVRGERVGDVRRRRARLLRLGDDVHRAAARRALLRAGDAAAGRRGDRGDRAPAAGHGGTARAAGPRPASPRRSRPPHSRTGTSCWSGPARWCRPTASSSKAARTSRKRCSPAKARRFRAAPGEPLWAGAVNRDNALVMRVAAAGEDTRLAAILRLTERAANARPAAVRSADRIAAVFVAIVLVLALATAIVWSVVRSGARARRHVRRPRRVVPVRACAGHAGGAGGGVRFARAPRRRAGARRTRSSRWPG